MRVLMLTHRLPYAPNRGDRLRAYHILRTLSQVAEVDLVSLVHDRDEASHASDLRGLARRVVTLPVSRVRNLVRSVPALATTRPLTHILLDAPGAQRAIETLVGERTPDVVLAYCSGMARFAVEPPLSHLPLVIDMVDVDSEKWRHLATISRSPLRWIYEREAVTLGRFEARAARHAGITLVVNGRERDALSALAPDACVRELPNGVDVSGLRPQDPPADGARVVFSGVMDYAPNVRGALWFARRVWPMVRQTRPDAELLLVGSNPVADIRALSAADPSIRVTGTVADVREFLWQASVAIAPLFTARGVQNKVLEAVAAGLPCVATQVVAAGLPREVTPACWIADSPVAFADAVLALLARTPAERRQLAGRAAIEGLDWTLRLTQIPALLREAIGRHDRDHRRVA